MIKPSHLFTSIFAVAAIGFYSCSNETANVNNIPVFNEPDPPVWTLNFDDAELGTADFETFNIERDYSALNEKLHTDPAKKMYEENTMFDDTVRIKFNGNNVTVNNDSPSDFTVETDGAHVTIKTKKDMVCVLSGTSDDGSLNVKGDNTVRITLKGVHLKNTNGPAISNQSKQTCFLVCEAPSELSDGGDYARLAKEAKKAAKNAVKDLAMNDTAKAEKTKKIKKEENGEDEEKEDKQKGCVFAKGYLAISGRAKLKIVATGADAIHSSKTIFVRRGSMLDIDSQAGSAIKAKNKVKIEGGVVNIYSTGAGGHGVAAKKLVSIAGGRTTIISETGAGIDEKNSRGIKSDSLVEITGGRVRVKESSVGGKGIAAGQKFHAQNCIVDVLTYGEDDKVTGSKNRGIKGKDEIRIDSSRVRVRTENGWNEGLSSRHKIVINNSLVELQTRDDAISAGEPKTADVEINNSMVYAFSGMDAIDSNGTLHVNSGLVYAIARSKLCRGFDCDLYEFKIGPEATIVSLGQITSPPTASLLEHPACFISRPLSDTEFCLTPAGSNTNLIRFAKPAFMSIDSTYAVLLSLPDFKMNASYDVCQHATVTPRQSFHGLQIGGTAENKQVGNTITLARNYHTFYQGGRHIRGTTARPGTATNGTATPTQTSAKLRRTTRTDSMNNMSSM